MKVPLTLIQLEQENARLSAELEEVEVEVRTAYNDGYSAGVGDIDELNRDFRNLIAEAEKCTCGGCEKHSRSQYTANLLTEVAKSQREACSMYLWSFRNQLAGDDRIRAMLENWIKTVLETPLVTPIPSNYETKS